MDCYVSYLHNLRKIGKMKSFVLSQKDCGKIADTLRNASIKKCWYNGKIAYDRHLATLAALFDQVNCSYVEVKQEEVCPACKRKN